MARSEASGCRGPHRSLGSGRPCRGQMALTPTVGLPLRRGMQHEAHLVLRSRRNVAGELWLPAIELNTNISAVRTDLHYPPRLAVINTCSPILAQAPVRMSLPGSTLCQAPEATTGSRTGPGCRADPAMGAEPGRQLLGAPDSALERVQHFQVLVIQCP